MKLFVLSRSSLIALKKHKIRSFLTVLGIMIGIAAIIVTFSVGRGAEEVVADQIMSMGENSVYIIPTAFIKHGALRGNTGITRLRERDIRAIIKLAPEVQEITPMHMTVQTVQLGSTVAQKNITGCYENTPKIDANVIDEGMYFNKSHIINRSNVAILGHTPKEELFGEKNPIGHTILIKGKPFKVIGVLKKKPHFFGPRDPSDQIFVPYTTSKKIFRTPDEAIDQLTAAAIRLYSGVDAEAFRRKLENILRFTHTFSNEDENPFTIFDQQTLEQIARAAAGVIRMFGLFAASISLIVGSIGVMNIMLVSVKERTKEIGLRMAIGATQRLIRIQFLFEAITLCFIGGLIGILIGFLLQLAIGYSTTLSPVMEITPMVVSLIVTVFIGVFFGYYPAHQASQLNPVEALLDK